MNGRFFMSKKDDDKGEENSNVPKGFEKFFRKKGDAEKPATQSNEDPKKKDQEKKSQEEPATEEEEPETSKRQKDSKNESKTTDS